MICLSASVLGKNDNDNDASSMRWEKGTAFNIVIEEAAY